MQFTSNFTTLNKDGLAQRKSVHDIIWTTY